MTEHTDADARDLRTNLYNLLEPPALIRHFQEWPPDGFSTFFPNVGAPAFAAPFDFLTTVEPSLRRSLDRLMRRHWLGRLRSPRTCFIGTTVSEYALLPTTMSHDDFVRELLSDVVPHYPFLIVKDIPTEPVLVGDAAFASSDRLADVCRRTGFVLLEGQALAYVPIDFMSIEDFLSRLSHARRRNVRRKLRSRVGIEIDEIRTGNERFEDESVVATFYDLYRNVYDQSEIHFDLLTVDFFRAVLRDSSSGGVIFEYRVDGKLIGYNLCFIHGGALVDKYVGFVYPQAREFNLYTVSWFHNLQYALTHGLRVYIAGWTDPAVKRDLGATFTFTRHAVYARNPILRAVLQRFKALFESDHHWNATHVPLDRP